MTVREASLAATVASLRSGERDVLEYVRELGDRIEAGDPDVESLVEDTFRRSRLESRATALRAVHSDPDGRPPLYGVPVGVKDIFHVDGLPTRAGSTLPPEALTGPEAASVARLRSAGALVAGKTVTTEFAYFEPGPTRNPHDLEHTPGGSSSGSAAGVAAGFFPLALGTQTVGSTIRPAAFCGIVGFKPTYGRIPVDGVIPLAGSLDHVGVFTQDAAGARLAASVLCDDWKPVGRVDPDRRLGVPSGPYLDLASREALDRFEDHLDLLADAGCEIVRVDAFGDIDAIQERHNRLMSAEAALVHHEWFEAYGDRYRDRTAALVREGRAVRIDQVASDRTGRTALREALAEQCDEHDLDLWVCPAATGPAPAGIESTGDPAMNLPWTHAGLPAISLPAGTASGGLPLGVQFVAPFMADERLLAQGERLAGALAEAD